MNLKIFNGKRLIYILIDTFESSLNMIDEPADFKEKLEDAVKNL